MRRFCNALWLACLLSAFFAAAALAAPATDEEGVYLISSASDLAWFRDRVNGGGAEIEARLTGSVDLGGHPWTPVGDKRKNAFNGIFDGNGFCIYGLFVTGERSYAGLFGCIGYGGVAQGLTIEGARVDARTASGDAAAGVLCGVNYGVVQDCSVTRSSLFVEDGEGAAAELNVGALAGRNDEGIILNSSVEQCAISAKLRYSTGKTLAVGGVTGMNVGTLPGMGLVQNCGAADNKLTVEARAQDAGVYAGGMLGLALSGMVRSCSIMAGEVENNYFMGSAAAIGGVIGSSMLGSYIENCAVGANLLVSVRGGAAESSAGGIAGTLIGSNVESSNVESLTIRATGDLPHTLGGLVGAFAGGCISNCAVASADLPNDPQAPYRVGAVAGVTFEVEILGGKPPTLIENTRFNRNIAGGRPVGSDSNPEHTDAAPFDEEEAPADAIGESDEALD